MNVLAIAAATGCRNRLPEPADCAARVAAVDFNCAYQPYCYLNPTDDCPLPPAENRLNVLIHAGEKLKP